MAETKKNIKLRAFKIANTNLTQSDSGILNMLRRVLTDNSTALTRKMKLNEQDPDEDLLSNYSWQQNSYLFGMMLRIIPAETGGVINDELFNQYKITINDLSHGGPDQHQYKDHYYFILNNNILITNLSGSYSIDRFQTYINWLLKDIRNTVIAFDPITKVPDGIKVSDISSIEFTDGTSSSIGTDLNVGGVSISMRVKEITGQILEYIFNDVDSLGEIRREDLVSAKLLLKIKSKPSCVTEEAYKKAMSAVTRQITNDSGLVIRTKNKRTFNGDAVKVVKDVKVEVTKNGNVVEEQLKQVMESFIEELMNQERNG